MKSIKWQIVLGAGLVSMSALLYILHYWFFRDAHHIGVHLFGDIAFVPFEVWLATLVIHKLIDSHEKKARLEKVNMVVEAFYSEIGLQLLERCHAASVNKEASAKLFENIGSWGESDFIAAKNNVMQKDFHVSFKVDELEGLRDFLMKKRDFLLRLWENPYVLEHESYSEVLRATLHLTEELTRRDNKAMISGEDLKHLHGDINRAFYLLTKQWVDYMMHLKINYPYLFSLANRLNPFSAEVSPYVK